MGHFCRNQKKPPGVLLGGESPQLQPIFFQTKNHPRLSSLASRSTWDPEKTGFFVIDPAEDCAAMGDVRQLLTTWSSQGQVPGKPVAGGPTRWGLFVVVVLKGPFEKVGKWSCWSNTNQSWNDQEM